MNLNLYNIIFLLFINNMIAIVVTENAFNFTFLTQRVNATNDTLISIEPAALYEYQFMCIVARKLDGKSSKISLDIVDEVHANKIMCGGAIIHEYWVITVAKCFKEEVKLNIVRIYAGIVDMYHLEGQQVRSVQSISIHPRFNRSSDEYNIAMLKVSESFVITKYVNRVRLSSTPMVPLGIENCYILKFIRGNDFANINITKLYKIQRRILGKLECSDRLKILKANQPVSDKNFCLVSHYDFRNDTVLGACQRDVGNPCICEHNLHGLISFATSDTCYRHRFPTIISDVGSHLNWIRSQILQLKRVAKSSSIKIFKNKIIVVVFIILLQLKLKL